MSRSRKSPVPAPVPESAAPGAALLAIDLQSSLLGALPAATSAAVTARASLAITAATTLRIPVLFSEQAPAKLGGTAPALRALAPSAPVFAKTTFSALAEPALLDSLRSQSIEHILIIGLETPVCVYQSALGSLAEGFQVTILSDAVAGRRAEDHATVLAALRASGVTVLPVETVLYALLHNAGHPDFKALTTLVKTHAAP